MSWTNVNALADKIGTISDKDGLFDGAIITLHLSQAVQVLIFTWVECGNVEFSLPKAEAQAGFEPATPRLWAERANHYTNMLPTSIDQF